MNFVYLSPHFPPNYQAFCIELRLQGANVLGLAEAPYDSLSPRLRNVLTEYYRVDDMHDYDQLVRALGYFTHQYGKIDRLESHAEYWLETEARLRTDFNITGLRAHDLPTMKRKSLMKQKFIEAGVEVVRGEVARDRNHALKIAKKLGFPLVAKPDIGVGAAGTFRFDDADALSAFYEQSHPHDYILEQYIDGVLTSFDGLVDRDGKPVLLASHVFSDGIMDVVSQDLDMFYYSERELPQDLEQAGRAVLAAYGLTERFFHFEFIRRHSDQKLVGLEVNMRPPGGLTTDMFNFANDIDIYRQWARVVVGKSFEPDPARPFHCCYIGRKDNRTYRHDHDQVLARAGDLLCHEERVQSVFRGAIGDHGYLLRSPQLNDLLEVANYALES
ncbi:MAG: acetyl-CoA carboxylase biotin carboxylase subunit family protein [Vulcanimicrobiota bacterium]